VCRPKLLNSTGSVQHFPHDSNRFPLTPLSKLCAEKQQKRPAQPSLMSGLRTHGSEHPHLLLDARFPT